ncbi:MAG: EVE domain-containing protein [Deltaproteobacteria bacterium]|nr:EVE domain-containing protein [Deltaproteobacteria bacterium]
MKYWLMKSEPTTFGIDDLMARPDGIDHWDGVRNYQARNFLRLSIQPVTQSEFDFIVALDRADLPGS